MPRLQAEIAATARRDCSIASDFARAFSKAILLAAICRVNPNTSNAAAQTLLIALGPAIGIALLVFGFAASRTSY
jgi:EamA domain-containing membrane protein RarD